jgi:predicted CXXCH cytochrome family protein
MRMNRLIYKLLLFFMAGCILVAFSDRLNAQPGIGVISGTPHNLSTSGPGLIKSTNEKRICVFCHTLHNASPDDPYLWNRSQPADNYLPYQSSSLYATVDQPTGVSKMCLSCHDGTIALGQLLYAPQEIPFEGGIRFLPQGASKIGTDLSDDHPISFTYDNALAIANNELALPATLPAEIRLDSDQQLQCTSCHDPHNNQFGKFLVMQNSYSALCTSCHTRTAWSASSHATSNAIWNGTGPDPWPRLSDDTVDKNACLNCHTSHNAGGSERLLNYSFEEDNCIICHNGNVALTDIEFEITKLYNHPVQDYINVHDPTEDFTAAVQDHVECADCHNPHQVTADNSPTAPQVSNINSGVSGINSAGLGVAAVNYQYEICYKCHADNNVIATFAIDRQIQELNTRLEFSSSNPSYHPVELQGVNPNVPSLLPPLTTSSILYCTDCHTSDDSSGPSGPHGSIYGFLLAENYATQDFTTENASNYALCYKCHDRISIISDASFPHNVHVVVNNTPCSACHDAHGISSTQGNSLNNSHLINFDVTIVQQDSQARLRFEDNGIFSGTCYLNCHGIAHEPKVYP